MCSSMSVSSQIQSLLQLLSSGSPGVAELTTLRELLTQALDESELENDYVIELILGSPENENDMQLERRLTYLDFLQSLPSQNADAKFQREALGLFVYFLHQEPAEKLKLSSDRLLTRVCHLIAVFDGKALLDLACDCLYVIIQRELLDPKHEDLLRVLRRSHWSV